MQTSTVHFKESIDLNKCFQGAIYLNKFIKYGLERHFLNTLEGMPMGRGGNWEWRHIHPLNKTKEKTE